MADNPEIWKAVAMADHFEKIQKLSEPIPGCPNFRRVPGYKVYCCGQPTAEGFEKALEKVCGTIYPKDGQIIHDIYQTAHTMFSDMPQGDHKKRAKYRFASKTLMRILPADLKGEVEGLIDKQSITLDLYDILGQCTWGQKKGQISQ